MCVFGNKAQLNDTLPKIHFDISIAMANNALALQVREENINTSINSSHPEWAAGARSCSCPSGNFLQKKGQRQTISEV